MNRRAFGFVAALVIVVGVVVVFLYSGHGDSRVQIRAGAVDAAVVSQRVALTAEKPLLDAVAVERDEHVSSPVAEIAFEEPALWLTARLVASHPVEAASFGGRAGVARVSEEDRREFFLWLETPDSGAGPSRFEDLANVRSWLPTPIEQTGENELLFGPVEVPRADVYHVLAYNSEGRHFWKEFIPPAELPPDGILDAGEVKLAAPTGLLLGFSENVYDVSHVLVEVERVVDAENESASEFLKLLPVINRELFDAIVEELPLIAGADEITVVAPLPADPAVRLRLRLPTGQQSMPMEVGLIKGRLLPVTINLSKAFSEDSFRNVDLHGRLLIGKAGEPARGAAVQLIGSFDAQRHETDADGRFFFRSLPAGETSRFSAEIPRPPFGFPATGEVHELAFDPREHNAETDQPIEADFVVPEYEWLVLELNDEFRNAVSRVEFPYPIYILQKRDGEDEWVDTRADEFIPVNGGMAVSIAAEGEYRVVMAMTPLEVYESHPARFDGTSGEQAVELVSGAPVQSAEVEVQFVMKGTHGPLSDAHITVTSTHGSLPPMSGWTDGAGAFSVGRLNAGRIAFHVQHDLTGEQEIVMTADELRRANYVVRVEFRPGVVE